MSEKLIFIIPGFRHKVTSKTYKKVGKILRQEGFTPITIQTSWNKKGFFQNAEFFISMYKKKLIQKKYAQIRKKVYILGFSYGAVVAYIASTKIKLRGLVLCSLSPYFKDNLTKKIKAKQVHIIYGTKEARSIIIKARKVFKNISQKQKYIFPLKSVDHEIGNKYYLNQIRESAALLN